MAQSIIDEIKLMLISDDHEKMLQKHDNKNTLALTNNWVRPLSTLTRNQFLAMYGMGIVGRSRQSPFQRSLHLEKNQSPIIDVDATSVLCICVCLLVYFKGSAAPVALPTSLQVKTSSSKTNSSSKNRRLAGEESLPEKTRRRTKSVVRES
ncbi:hypothetical protein CR513_33587, partial [Mucuna pruriens]